MFLRKLTVIAVPLMLCAIVCALLPFLSGLGFFTWALIGLVLGVALALLLPVSGAGRKKEPFAGLLWVPAILLVLVAAYQYVSSMGMLVIPLLSILHTVEPNVVLIECTFAGYMMATCVRTKK